MQVLIAQLINGLSTGSIYVLLVTGFNLLLLVAMIIHFSYPQVVVFSMYIAWVVLKYTGNNLVLGVLAAVAASILMNVVSAPLGSSAMARKARPARVRYSSMKKADTATTPTPRATTCPILRLIRP